MKRRQFAKAIAGTGITAIAGCTEEGSSSDGSQETECRMVERSQKSTAYNDLDTWSAGNLATWDFDLDEGEQVFVKAVKVEGARPDLEVKGPRGEMLIDTGPTANIERGFTAAESGTYYITLTNEAIMTSGQWDVTIEVTKKYEEQVCS